MERQYITTAQLAEKLQFSEQYVRRLASQGIIPCIGTPGQNTHFRFILEDVEKALAVPRQEAGE